MPSLGCIYRDRGRWFIQLPNRLRIWADKQHRSFYSREHAQYPLVAIQSEIQAGTFDPEFYSKTRKSVHSFSVYAETWLSICQKKVERGTMSRAHYVHLRGYVNRLWIPFFGETSIPEIRGKDIKAFYYSLTQGPKAVYNAMNALHKLFADAFDEEIIQATPKFPSELKASNIPEPEWKWASEEIQNSIFEHLEPEDLYFILFQCCHGTRTGETRALQHGDIDLENNTVTIARAFSDQDLRHTKSKRIRKIPLDPVWREVYVSRPRSITPNVFVFLRDGKPFSESWARKRWNEARNKAGVGHITLYAGSRHSLASQAANRGASIYAIAKFLGHSNLKVTERYAHLNTNPLLQVQRQGTVTPLKKKSTQ